MHTESTSLSSDCPFCRQNGLLKGEVTAETGSAYLLPAQQSPGCYLIIPTDHIEAVNELPDDWWRSFKELLPQVPDVPSSYNISLNIGPGAGQTVKHLHFWVVPRPAGDPASGKGLARLIAETNRE